MNKIVDARGMACPLPVVNAKKAVQELGDGDELTVLIDNEIAVQNLQKFANHNGFTVTNERLGEHEFSVKMIISSKNNTQSVQTISRNDDKEEIQSPSDTKRKGMIVVLSASAMGMGDEKLGISLMKAFVFALTKQDILPETILCYNTGAYLTCEGADTLEDLKNLESEGVNIMTCGTCLDFYHLKEKLVVGSVTNMYEIVEIMENASKVIRP